MSHSTEIPHSLHPIIRKTLNFAATMLKVRPVFYPFAAIQEGDNFRCVFSDHVGNDTNPSDLIDVLQWKLIDRVIDKPVQSVLAYAADVKTHSEQWKDAIAVDVTDEDGKEYFYAFAYQIASDGIAFRGPLVVNH